MNLAAATIAAIRTLRRDPADLLPLYLLGAAVPVVVRSLLLVSLVAIYVHLSITGRVESVRDDLQAMDFPPPDPEVHPEAFADWTAELTAIMEVLFTPAVLIVLAGTILVAGLLTLLLSAAVAAGQIAACHSRIRNQRGLRAGIRGIGRYWRAFLGVYLLEGLLWLFVSIPAGLLVGFGVLSAATEPAVGVIVIVLGVLFWIVGIVLVRAAFVFAPVAIAVDEVGAIDAVRRSLWFIRQHPGDAIGYFVIALGLFFGFGAMSSILAIVGIGTLSALIAILILLPAMDLFKTALYVFDRHSTDPSIEPGPPIRDQAAAGLRRGWLEMVDFVGSSPGLHLLSVFIAAGGFVAGWIVGTPYAGVVETSIANRLVGHFPPTAALEFFGNNWTVTMGIAFAGVGLALPAILSLGMNGFVFGLVFRLEIEPIDLLLFVLPHGFFEIPALVIAGALGLFLGIAALRYIRGQISSDTLADAFERAFWVLVGIGILLAIAGFIEGFVSPYYATLFR